MDQSHCVPGEARWRPQEPGPGEPHMGSKQPDPGEVQVGPQLQGPGEAHVATGFTKSRGCPGGEQSPSRCGPAKDQIHQAQVKPKG